MGRFRHTGGRLAPPCERRKDVLLRREIINAAITKPARRLGCLSSRRCEALEVSPPLVKTRAAAVGEKAEGGAGSLFIINLEKVGVTPAAG